MTGTWETWSSTFCRPGTWPPGTTMATQTLLSRFTSYLGEGELPVFFEASGISAPCLPFCFCVCLVVSPLFSFWPCIHCTVWNWLTDSVCMREWEWIRWHEAVIAVSPWLSGCFSQRSTSIQAPPFSDGAFTGSWFQPILVLLFPLCGGTSLLFWSLRSKRKNRYTFSCSVTVSALR